MPRFMGLVRMEENVGTPPQALLRGLVPWSVLALPLGPFSVAAFLGVYSTGVSGSLHRGIPDQAGGTLVISTR